MLAVDGMPNSREPSPKKAEAVMEEFEELLVLHGIQPKQLEGEVKPDPTAAVAESIG